MTLRSITGSPHGGFTYNTHFSVSMSVVGSARPRWSLVLSHKEYQELSASRRDVHKRPVESSVLNRWGDTWAEVNVNTIQASHDEYPPMTESEAIEKGYNCSQFGGPEGKSVGRLLLSIHSTPVIPYLPFPSPPTTYSTAPR